MLRYLRRLAAVILIAVAEYVAREVLSHRFRRRRSKRQSTKERYA